MIAKACIAIALFLFAGEQPAEPRAGDDLVTKSQQAKQAMAAGEFQRAAELYSDLVHSVPANPGLLLNLGMARFYERRYTDAIQALKAALKLQPQLAPANFFLGLSFEKLHQPSLAIAPLRSAVSSGGKNKLFQLEYADALLATNRFTEAKEHFNALAAIAPEEPKAWQGLGLSYAGLSQACFQALQRVAPESPYVLVLLGDSDLKQMNYRSAYALFKVALARDRAIAGAYSGLAEVYRRTGHPDWAAIEDQKGQKAKQPDCARSPAACAYRAGRYAEATRTPGSGAEALYWKTRAYETLALDALNHLTRMPPTPQIHELMAEAYTIRGQTHEAAQELREALQLDPGDARIEALYATALWRDHDYRVAQTLLEKLVANDPNSAELYFELGDALLQQDEMDKAAAILRKAVQLNPRLLPAQASLGRAYMANGQPSEAIPHLRAAAPIDADGSLHLQLARAYAQTGQTALAEQAQQEFEVLSKANQARNRTFVAEAEIAAP